MLALSLSHPAFRQDYLSVVDGTGSIVLHEQVYGTRITIDGIPWLFSGAASDSSRGRVARSSNKNRQKCSKSAAKTEIIAVHVRCRLYTNCWRPYKLTPNAWINSDVCIIHGYGLKKSIHSVRQRGTTINEILDICIIVHRPFRAVICIPNWPTIILVYIGIYTKYHLRIHSPDRF